MDPDFRKDGLLAIGAAEATFSPSSLEQYDALARSVIAADVLSEKTRKSLAAVPRRQPKHAPDSSCAAQTIGTYGRLLFRRPLTQDELRIAVGIADDQARETEWLLSRPRIRASASAPGVAQFPVPDGCGRKPIPVTRGRRGSTSIRGRRG